MPMIGAKGADAIGRFDPSQMSGSDKLMMFGATLRDVGASLRGGDAEAVAGMQALLANRQMMAQRAKLLGQASGLMNGDQPPTPQYVGMPTTKLVPQHGAAADGLNLPDVQAEPGGVNLDALRAPTPQRQPVGIDDPRWGELALAGPQYGLNLDGLWKLQEMRQPHVQIGPGGEAYNDKDPGALGRVFRNPTNVNGWVTDLNNPKNEGQYFPALQQGMIPDGHGGVANATGLLPAIQGQEEAQTLGRTRGTMLTVPRSDGSTALMTGGEYLGGSPLVAQRGGQPGSAPGLGVSQTPGARAAAEAAGGTEGKAGAEARVNYPAVAQRATQSLNLIDDLIKDPHLEDRVGWGSKFPAIPGGTDPGIEAKLAQLQGTTFLQAYNELKGAGAITEIEGSKAEAAIARLQRRDQSYGDYVQALRDLREVISGGVGRAQQRAQMGGGEPVKTGAAPPRPAAALSSIPLDARLQEARRRGLIK
jgi:hypothetical protein